MSDFDSCGTDISTKINRLERAFENLTGMLGKAGIDVRTNDLLNPRPPRAKPTASPRRPRAALEKERRREPERALSSLSTSAGSSAPSSTDSHLERPHSFRSPRKPKVQAVASLGIAHERDLAAARSRAEKLDRARVLAEEQALQALQELGEAPAREAKRLVQTAVLPGALGEPKQEAGRLVTAAEARAGEYRRLAAEWEHRAHEARRVQRAVDSDLDDLSSRGLDDRRRRSKSRERRERRDDRASDFTFSEPDRERGTQMLAPRPVTPKRPRPPPRPSPPRPPQPRHLVDHVTELIAPPPDVYLDAPELPRDDKPTPDQLPAAGIESSRTDERADSPPPRPRRAHSAPRLRQSTAEPRVDKERIQGNRWHREAAETGSWLPTGRPPSAHSSCVDRLGLGDDPLGLVGDEPCLPLLPTRSSRPASRSGTALTPSMDLLHRTAAELGMRTVDTKLEEGPRGRHSRYPPTSHRAQADGHPLHSPSGSSLGMSRLPSAPGPLGEMVTASGLLWVPPNLRLSHRESQLSAAYGRSLAHGQHSSRHAGFDRARFLRTRSRTPSRPSTSDYTGMYVCL